MLLSVRYTSMLLDWIDWNSFNRRLEDAALTGVVEEVAAEVEEVEAGAVAARACKVL
jgi:hypothetical protein